MKYFNTTLQFHAPLDTLKAPPPGYQQPPIDIERGLSNIQSMIDAGSYKNQYEFESDVHHLVTRMHDAHIILNAGIMSTFSFASPYGLISVSADGKALPKVYVDSRIAIDPYYSVVLTLFRRRCNSFAKGRLDAISHHQDQRSRSRRIPF